MDILRSCRAAGCMRVTRKSFCGWALERLSSGAFALRYPLKPTKNGLKEIQNQYATRNHITY
jgi:hypothetical protein